MDQPIDRLRALPAELRAKIYAPLVQVSSSVKLVRSKGVYGRQFRQDPASVLREIGDGRAAQREASAIQRASQFYRDDIIAAKKHAVTVGSGKVELVFILGQEKVHPLLLQSRPRLRRCQFLQDAEAVHLVIMLGNRFEGYDAFITKYSATGALERLFASTPSLRRVYLSVAATMGPDNARPRVPVEIVDFPDDPDKAAKIDGIKACLNLVRRKLPSKAEVGHVAPWDSLQRATAELCTAYISAAALRGVAAVDGEATLGREREDAQDVRDLVGEGRRLERQLAAYRRRVGTFMASDVAGNSALVEEVQKSERRVMHAAAR